MNAAPKPHPLGPVGPSLATRLDQLVANDEMTPEEAAEEWYAERADRERSEDW